MGSAMNAVSRMGLVALLASISATGYAQHVSPPHIPPAHVPPPQPPPYVAPPSTLPSAPAALTVPMPLGPPPGTIDLYHRADGFHSNSPQQLPSFVGGGYWPYDPGSYGAGNAPSDAYVQERVIRPAKGGLRFETYPGTAQVFVDGNYVGIADDFGINGRALELAAGSHEVELRAPGYAATTFDVAIVPDQVRRYRGDLSLSRAGAPAAATAARASAVATAKKYYVIPNCYAGTRPPARALPPTCSLKAMRVIEP